MPRIRIPLIQIKKMDNPRRDTSASTHSELEIS